MTHGRRPPEEAGRAGHVPSRWTANEMNSHNIIKKLLKILSLCVIGLFVLFAVMFTMFGAEHTCTKLSSNELKQLEKRAEAGDIRACKDLSYHFCEDEELMAKWDKKAADLGDAESKYKYGSFLIYRKNYADGINYLTQAAEQGYVSAMIDLAHLYVEKYDDRKHFVDSYKLVVLAHMIMKDNNYYEYETSNLKKLIKDKSVKSGYSFEIVSGQGQAAALKAFEAISKRN